MHDIKKIIVMVLIYCLGGYSIKCADHQHPKDVHAEQLHNALTSSFANDLVTPDYGLAFKYMPSATPSAPAKFRVTIKYGSKKHSALETPESVDIILGHYHANTQILDFEVSINGTNYPFSLGLKVGIVFPNDESKTPKVAVSIAEAFTELAHEKLKSIYGSR